MRLVKWVAEQGLEKTATRQEIVESYNNQRPDGTFHVNFILIS